MGIYGKRLYLWVILVFHWTLRKHLLRITPRFHALRFTICILVYCTIARMSSFSGQCERLSKASC
jgi:hypothetical protein